MKELDDLSQQLHEAREDLKDAHMLLGWVLLASGGTIVVGEGIRREMPQKWVIQTEKDCLGKLRVSIQR